MEIKKTIEYLREKSNLPQILLLFFSVLYSVKIIKLSSGLVVNNYPFISPDGFDWITEGYWVSTLIKGFDLSNLILPYARPPVFVLITTLDSLSGQNGYGIAIALGISLFGTGYYVLKFIEKDINIVLSIMVLVSLFLTPVNFVRKWILSDAICVFLSLFSTYYLFEIVNNRSSVWRWILLSISIALAGLTQLYGLIAPFVGIGTMLLYGIKNKQREIVISLLILGIVSITVFELIGTIWYGFVPHNSTPIIMQNLRLSSGMLNFYIHTWGYYFIPFVPLLIVGLLGNIKDFFRNRFLVSLWLTVVVFMILALFYQWRESRFTFIFWPFFIAALFKTYIHVGGRFQSQKKVLFLISAALVMVQSILLYTNNEWQPNLREIGIDPKKTWVSSYVLSKPIDRLQLQNNCLGPNRICEKMVIDGDSYVKIALDTYLMIFNRNVR